MVEFVINALLITLCGGLLTFVVRFLFWSNWRSTLVGRYIMAFLLTITGMFIYIFIARLIPNYPGRDAVNIIILLILNYGAWKLAWLIIHIQRKGDDNESVT